MSAGNLQLCGGQKSGAEKAMTAATELFEDVASHGILQIDANNTFNFLNRKVALQNLRILCPELAIFTNKSSQWKEQLRVIQLLWRCMQFLFCHYLRQDQKPRK